MKPEKVVRTDDLVAARERKLLFAQITEEEERQKANPSTIDSEAPPDIVGGTVLVTLTGYRKVTKPYDQRCKNGHHVPAGANCFTDDREIYCPYCGASLDIA